jgi:hypothetical protein
MYCKEDLQVQEFIPFQEMLPCVHFVLTSGTLGTGTLNTIRNTLTFNVAVGTYVVRVTDTATGCFADGTIVIGEPANALTITSATTPT